ncbi:MAG TPA: Rne/Rng family ribonuclease [Gaiellaceae bacterium]|nr:Rne/Rng family ribonuclease [Gaiellaceae bacterium]
MLRWFRRQKPSTDERAHQQDAPPAPTQTVTPRPVEAGTTDPAKKKRRRGSRGGRNRKRSGSGAAAAAQKAEPEEPKQEPKKEPKKDDSRPDRRPSQRKQRATRRRTPPRRPPLPPAKRELLISVDVSEQRVAVLEDDKVAEAYLERPERRSIAGNIYKGSVDNVLPGMEAAFIEIGLEKNGFLYVDEVIAPELEGRSHGRKIQDLLSRGQEVLVQAVKDPMKSKGARLTTEISLPGRFVVFVPHGEGLGVSRRLEDDERTRLRDIVKKLDVKKGGVIVRTAAEGASAEDVERDLVFLQRLWKTIETSAKAAKAPSLVYQEAELPLRVIRDLFTDDFEKAVVDHERTYKRVVGYLKKTSPHMADRVVRYREKTPLMESSGVDAQIRSTLSRRVDLPSGGYLVFDYAEAFTVIDVNTGRFVGSRGKSSGGRLEDTITKNNLEAVKEVVRQLRLRDIGGIIVIDFIDMANPKNRATVEEALKSELERDRTKTYVVEISPLGLVEMTRQNVTDGPREILTRKCVVCGGDGVVLSETSAAVDAERRLRTLAASAPRTKAFKVELESKVAAILIGPGASRLQAIEEDMRRRFLLVAREDAAVDHFEVLGKGTLESLLGEDDGSKLEGKTVELKLGEVDRYDVHAGVGKLDGVAVCVANASKLVGKKAKVRIERVVDGTAYATLVGGRKADEAPITAESAAEKPTRKPPAKKQETPPKADAEAEVAAEPEEAEEPETGEPEVEAVAEETDSGPEQPPKKKTRRGSRGGRRRKKKPATAEANGDKPAAEEQRADGDGDGDGEGEGPKIHLPDPSLGREEPESQPQAEAQSENGAEADGEQAKPKKKKTRRGSRGGRNRKRRSTSAAAKADSAPTD